MSDFTKPRKIRYAICGLSVRGIYHFILPLVGGRSGNEVNNFESKSTVTGILDVDADRVTAFQSKFGLNIPFFHAGEGVEKMLAEASPDVLLVAGPDDTHVEGILAGLRHGLKVIVEKPMVTTSEDARLILAEERKSRGSLLVAHNYRYATVSRLLKRLMMEGKVGRVTNVEFVYNLDTRHGASYFYRWNRLRRKSGGLSVHKSVHHIDLINWLLDSTPETVFSFGALNYYGSEGAHRPRSSNGTELSLAETRASCPYFRRHFESQGAPIDKRILLGWDGLNLPYNVQYPEDAYLYDGEIDIEDTYASVFRYRNGAMLSYSCNFSTPWEGFTLGINGTEGRIEVTHRSNPDPTGLSSNPSRTEKIIYYPLFGGREEFPLELEQGGHGGADGHIQRDLFDGPAGSGLDEALKMQSDAYAGAIAIAAGEAIWKSARDGRPYTMAELLGDEYRAN